MTTLFDSVGTILLFLLIWYLLQTVSIMCVHSIICYICIRVDLLFLGPP